MNTKITIGNCASYIEAYCDRNSERLSNKGVARAARLMVRYLTKRGFFEEFPEDEIESAAYAAIFDARISEALSAC